MSACRHHSSCLHTCMSACRQHSCCDSCGNSAAIVRQFSACGNCAAIVRQFCNISQHFATLCCDRAAIVLRSLKIQKIFERIQLRLCCDCAAIVRQFHNISQHFTTFHNISQHFATLCCDCAAIELQFVNILAVMFSRGYFLIENFHIM